LAQALQFQLVPQALVGDRQTVLSQPEYEFVRSLGKWSGHEKKWKDEFDTLVRGEAYDCGDETMSENRCCSKGDCLRFGQSVLSAGASACRIIAGWVHRILQERKDPDSGTADTLSVWSSTVISDTCSVEPVAPIGYSMLAHALLSPYRIILVSLELFGLTTEPCRSYRFKTSRERTLEFVVLYAWLHSFNICWEAVAEVRLNMHDWKVAAWNAVAIGDVRESSRIWSRSPEVESDLARAHRLQGDALHEALQKLRSAGKAAKLPCKLQRRVPRSSRKIRRTAARKAKLKAKATAKVAKRKARTQPKASCGQPVGLADGQPKAGLDDDLPLSCFLAPKLVGQAVEKPTHAAPSEPTPEDDLDASSRISRLDRRPHALAGLAAASNPAVPSRPSKTRGADFDFIRLALGGDRWDRMRSAGYSMSYDRRSGQYGSYSATLFFGFAAEGKQTGTGQVDGSRTKLRDADNHGRVVRLIYNTHVLNDLNARCFESGLEPLDEVQEPIVGPAMVASRAGSASEFEIDAQSDLHDDSDCDVL